MRQHHWQAPRPEDVLSEPRRVASGVDLIARAQAGIPFVNAPIHRCGLSWSGSMICLDSDGVPHLR